MHLRCRCQGQSFQAKPSLIRAACQDNRLLALVLLLCLPRRTTQYGSLKPFMSAAARPRAELTWASAKLTLLKIKRRQDCHYQSHEHKRPWGITIADMHERL